MIPMWKRPDILVLALIVAVVGAFLLLAAGLKVPHQRKIGDCTAKTNQFRIRVPNGAGYNLVLADLPSERGSDPASATNQNPVVSISITDEHGVRYARLLTMRNAQECNWVAKHGHPSAIILTWPDADPGLRLEQALEKDKEYSVTLIVERPFTNRPSLWLCWLGWPTLGL